MEMRKQYSLIMLPWQCVSFQPCSSVPELLHWLRGNITNTDVCHSATASCNRHVTRSSAEITLSALESRESRSALRDKGALQGNSSSCNTQASRNAQVAKQAVWHNTSFSLAELARPQDSRCCFFPLSSYEPLAPPPLPRQVSSLFLALCQSGRDKSATTKPQWALWHGSERTIE